LGVGKQELGKVVVFSLSLEKGERKMLGTILIVILVLMLLGAVGTVPVWPHSREWGYGPSGGLGLIVVVLLVLLLMRGF
jgi:hypothetical protein